MNRKHRQYKYVHVRIQNELAQAIEGEARKSYRSKSQIFRDALSLFLSKNSVNTALINK